jgi:hypothetical protein
MSRSRFSRPFVRQCLLRGPEQDIFFLMGYGFAGSSCGRYGGKRHPVLSALTGRGRRCSSSQSFFESVHREGFLRHAQPAENAPALGRNGFEILTKGEILYQAKLEAIDYCWFGSNHDVSLAMRSSEREARLEGCLALFPTQRRLSSCRTWRRRPRIERVYEWRAWNLERQP